MFSPTLENELRVSYSRNNQTIGTGDFKFPGLDAFPNISIDDLQLQIGPDPNTPTGSIENLSQLQENLTKTWGRHTFKAGFNMSDIILSGFFVQRARGDYDYSTLEEFLLDKQPTGGSLSGVSGERSVGTANGVPFGFLQTAAYLNDDFRVRPNLTLNLGLRYEYVTVPVGSRAQRLSSIADVPGVINFASPPSRTRTTGRPAWASPYTPGRNGSWSIRGGVSMSYDNTYINLAQNASPAYYQTTVDVNGANPVSNFLANGGLIGTAPAAATPGRCPCVDRILYLRPAPALRAQRYARRAAPDRPGLHDRGAVRVHQGRPPLEPDAHEHRKPGNGDTQYSDLFDGADAAQLAANTLTLGALQTTPLAGGTADLPYNNLAIYGFEQAMTAYHPWGNSRYNGLAVADEQALFEQLLVYGGLYLEPQFRRFDGHQFLDHSFAAPRAGLPESCGRNGRPPRWTAGTASP